MSRTPMTFAPVAAGTYTVVARFPGSADYAAATTMANFRLPILSDEHSPGRAHKARRWRQSAPFGMKIPAERHSQPPKRCDCENASG